MSITKYFIPDNFFWRLLAGKEGKRRFWSLVHNSPLHWWICLLTPSRGTLSVLFGVHQFIYHPITVARAWKWLYGRWPTFHEWIAIFCHDLGYLGKNAMDSPEGQTHPEFGAALARKVVYWSLRLRGRSSFDAGTVSDEIYDLCLFHSTHYAQMKGNVVSALYLPDKACILFDPPWWYLMRGKWSGEVFEYTNRENSKEGMHMTPEEWFYRYREFIKRKTDTFFDSGFRK